MNWTKTPPTEPGKYYWREKPTMDWEAKTVFEDLTAYSNDLYDDKIVHVITLAGEWGGRVPAPGTTWNVEQVDQFLNTFSDYDEVSKVKEFLEYPVDGIAAVTRNKKEDRP